jgi:hypothetical protein
MISLGYSGISACTKEDKSGVTGGSSGGEGCDSTQCRVHWLEIPYIDYP